ncbi:PREDICTED: alpha carbonic anhydrase 8-like [Nicotiana attenuata]|uniref:alpha carbonic anhydrase 8-like n=1 Tax=Nicotiana attenuata TaxID=49451 RepID=UPI000905770F|nr:PREDICTED: alpha carbonic anhydrase 8-like [Nicotiana attenuata]
MATSSHLLLSLLLCLFFLSTPTLSRKIILKPTAPTPSPSEETPTISPSPSEVPTPSPQEAPIVIITPPPQSGDSPRPAPAPAPAPAPVPERVCGHHPLEGRHSGHVGHHRPHTKCIHHRRRHHHHGKESHHHEHDQPPVQEPAPSAPVSSPEVSAQAPESG